MAAIGSILLSPESSWLRVDDTNTKIVYNSATWQSYSVASLYGGSYHYSNPVVGATVKFKFYGTKFRIISAANTTKTANVAVTIDGVASGSLTQKIGTGEIYQQLQYEKTDLDLSYHTVTLVSNEALEFTLDAIDIDDTGFLVTIPGCILSVPEEGWKRLDTTQYTKFTGGAATNYTAVTGSRQEWASTVTATIKFVGTQVRLIAYGGGTYSSSINITIDGVTEVFSEGTITNAATMIYEKIGLADTEHTVELKSNNGNMTIDSVDINTLGSLVYPFLSIKSSIEDMQIGDAIPCKYVATSGVVGAFSELGVTTASLLTQVPVAAPNGSFHFVFAGYDTRGRMKLVADRNIQFSIAHDVLNTKGIGTGEGLPIDLGLGVNYATSVRLLTGGTTLTDTDNEWDKIIVGSTLGGKIVPGDKSVWNWGSVATWTSTSGTVVANKVTRGNATASTTTAPAGISTATVNTLCAFRPVLIVENLIPQNISPVINSLLKTLTYNNRQVQLSAASVSDADAGNKVKYEVSITKPDATIIVKRSYDEEFQSSPLTFETLSFNVAEFGVGTNTVTVSVKDDQTPPGITLATVSVVKAPAIRTLIQDGTKWKYVNGNSLMVAIADYTADTAENKELAFLTNGMGLSINLNSVLNAQIENPTNLRVAIEKIDLLS